MRDRAEIASIFASIVKEIIDLINSQIEASSRLRGGTPKVREADKDSLFLLCFILLSFLTELYG